MTHLIKFALWIHAKSEATCESHLMSNVQPLFLNSCVKYLSHYIGLILVYLLLWLQ